MPAPECGLVFHVLWKELRSAAPGTVTGGRGGNARARTPHPHSAQSFPLQLGEWGEKTEDRDFCLDGLSPIMYRYHYPSVTFLSSFM